MQKSIECHLPHFEIPQLSSHYMTLMLRLQDQNTSSLNLPNFCHESLVVVNSHQYALVVSCQSAVVGGCQ